MTGCSDRPGATNRYLATPAPWMWRNAQPSSNASVFERALFACLELGALDKEKLFIELARRFGSAL